MKAYSFAFDTRTLTITKDFAEKANNPKSAECQIIKAFQADFPTMKIKQRTHKTPAKYHTAEGEVLTRNKRKGMTYERMERFIDALPRAKVYREEYDFIKANALNPYKTASDWFVAQFPKFRTDPLYYALNDAEIVKASDYINAKRPATDEEKAG